MSIDALRAALDRHDQAASCSGTIRPTERVAIALPDGDVGAVDDPGFVAWLVAHGEPAPYGEGTKTKLDRKVRDALRLVARGTAVVHGFDPASILGAIEPVLSPGAHLEARLTDILVYPTGGKFVRHKDTPRALDLIGTLVVGLPIAHTGGAFIVDDGRAVTRHDWSEVPRDVLPWVALFSDVDHAIDPVTSGSRVTLVYALHRTTRQREGDVGWMARRAALVAAARGLAPKRWPLMIAGARHAVAVPGTRQPQGIETLRGIDRELAEVLVEAGYQVGVRACVAPVASDDPTPRAERGSFPPLASVFFPTRMKEIPPAEIWDSEWEIEQYILDIVDNDQWLVSRHAAATLAHENSEWAEPGAFGNEGFSAILYTLAALEVTKAKKPIAKTKAEPKVGKVRAKAKPQTKTKTKTNTKTKTKTKTKMSARRRPRA